MSRLSRWLAALLLTLGGAAAGAHELSMAEMQVREIAPGQYIWQWTASGDRAPSSVLTPVWPAQCADNEGQLDCGEQGLTGMLHIEGVGERYSAAIVRIYWRDGDSVFTLTQGQPEVQLFGSAEDRRSLVQITGAYLVLGVEHILGGIDHLAFVVGLLFLVGFRRQLVWTITAFTVAHSLTLVLSALGWLTLRPPPVEATIALSIMLVAGEALHDRPTLARRWPALVAFLFGLVHGLGFAGALSAIGLPQKHLLPALLTFNAGVELGQLLVVGLAWLLWRALREQEFFQRARWPVLYGIGGVAAYWSLARIAAILA